MSEEQALLPHNWDWVTARVECSERKFFERLYLGAQGNIKKRMELIPPTGARKSFKCESSDQMFSVFSEAADGPTVRFRLEVERIHIESARGDINFNGTVTLDNQGRCRLRVGSEELDEWQVLKRALEKLLFPEGA